MGFSRQEYWNGLPFPSPGDLPYPGIKPMSPVSPALKAECLPLSHSLLLTLNILYIYVCVCVCMCVGREREDRLTIGM